MNVLTKNARTFYLFSFRSFLSRIISRVGKKRSLIEPSLFEDEKQISEKLESISLNENKRRRCFDVHRIFGEKNLRSIIVDLLMRSNRTEIFALFFVTVRKRRRRKQNRFLRFISTRRDVLQTSTQRDEKSSTKKKFFSSTVAPMEILVFIGFSATIALLCFLFYRCAKKVCRIYRESAPDHSDDTSVDWKSCESFSSSFFYSIDRKFWKKKKKSVFLQFVENFHGVFLVAKLFVDDRTLPELSVRRPFPKARFRRSRTKRSARRENFRVVHIEISVKFVVVFSQRTRRNSETDDQKENTENCFHRS